MHEDLLDRSMKKPIENDHELVVKTSWPTVSEHMRDWPWISDNEILVMSI